MPVRILSHVPDLYGLKRKLEKWMISHCTRTFVNVCLAVLHPSVPSHVTGNRKKCLSCSLPIKFAMKIWIYFSTSEFFSPHSSAHTHAISRACFGTVLDQPVQKFSAVPLSSDSEPPQMCQNGWWALSQVKSPLYTFIYTVLYTINIVSKQLYCVKQEDSVSVM